MNSATPVRRASCGTVAPVTRADSTNTSSSPSTDEARRIWGLETPGLGISLGGTHGPAQAESHGHWIDLAESLGIHSVWLPEMHFQPGVCPSPLLELAGYAARTKRMRLGTTSLLLPLHPAEKIAAEIATLDQISGGRLLIGLGRGFQKPMLEAFGVPPAEKRDRFDDALDQMLALWSEHNGRATRSALQTLQRPHPPLAVAAFGPKGLAQSARRDLPYLASPVETFDQILDNQERHRAGLPDPSKPALSLVMRTVFISESESEIEAARKALLAEMGGRRKGMPKAVSEAMDAPLEARAVIGTPDEVRERLVAERARLGIDLLVTRPQLRGVEEDVLIRSLEHLAKDVWPAVAET